MIYKFSQKKPLKKKYDSNFPQRNLKNQLINLKTTYLSKKINMTSAF